MSPRPRTFTQTSHMASSTPLHPSHPQFEAHLPFYPPQLPRSSVCDSLAETPNAELTLQERNLGVIIPPIYYRTSLQSSQLTQRDTRLRQKPKKPSIFLNPRGYSPQNPKIRPFLAKKVTILVIFSNFLYKYLSEPHNCGTAIFVSPRTNHSYRLFDPPFGYLWFLPNRPSHENRKLETKFFVLRLIFDQNLEIFSFLPISPHWLVVEPCKWPLFSWIPLFNTRLMVPYNLIFGTLLFSLFLVLPSKN